MEVYLTREALLELEGQVLDRRYAGQGGLLLGHKRGQHFFIEKVFPCRPSYFLSTHNFWALDRHFQGKIVGFYSLGKWGKRRAWLLQPFACGKVSLEVKPGRKALKLRPALLHFHKRFYLQAGRVLSDAGEEI